jgi:hypothetical protein
VVLRWCRCRLERSVAANVHRVADAEALYVAAGSGTEDGARAHLIREAEARLNVAVDGGGVAAVIAAEETLVVAVEDVVRNVPPTRKKSFSRFLLK